MLLRHDYDRCLYLRASSFSSSLVFIKLLDCTNIIFAAVLRRFISIVRKKNVQLVSKKRRKPAISVFL